MANIIGSLPSVNLAGLTSQPLSFLQDLLAQAPDALAQKLLPPEAIQALARDMSLGSASLQQGWQALTGGGNEDNTLLSALPDEQLQKRFGAQASDLQSMGEMTVGQASNLAGKGGIMDSVKEILSARTDLKVGDVTSKNGTRLLPVLQDPETRELLAKSQKLMPNDLNELKSQIGGAVKDPAMAQMAFKQATQILAQRDDLKPQQIGQLFGDVMNAVGKNPDSAATGLSMFSQAGEMLKSGKSPEEIGHLLTAAKEIGGGGGQNQATGVANAFQTAAETMNKRPDMKPEQLSQMARVVGQKFPGKDNQDRLRAFEQGTELMGASNSVDHKTIDTMLTRGQEQGLKGEKLLRSFETQGDALKSGAESVHTMSDKGTKGLEFGQDGRLVQGKAGARPTGEKQGESKTADSKEKGRQPKEQLSMRPATGRAAFAIAFAPGGLTH